MPRTGWTVVALVLLAGCASPAQVVNDSDADVTTVAWSFFKRWGAAGSDQRVCWDAIGNGSVRETGVTFGDATRFATPPTGGFTLPFTACANATRATTGARDVVAFAGGVKSAPRTLHVAAAAAAPVFTEPVPTQGTPGTTVAVCWSAAGEGRVRHTALHWDARSRPNATDVVDYRGGTYFPGGITNESDDGYALPGPWCADVRIPPHGDVFVRAHAIDVAGLPGRFSDERRISAR